MLLAELGVEPHAPERSLSLSLSLSLFLLFVCHAYMVWELTTWLATIGEMCQHLTLLWPNDHATLHREPHEKKHETIFPIEGGSKLGA